MIFKDTQPTENVYSRLPGINLYNRAWIMAFQESCKEMSQETLSKQLPPFFLMISGSRGRGVAHPNSDIDILTIVSTIQDMNSKEVDKAIFTILSGLNKHFIKLVEKNLAFRPLKNWLGLVVDVNNKTEQNLQKIRKAHPDTAIEYFPGMSIVSKSTEFREALRKHHRIDPATSYRAFKIGIKPTKQISDPYPIDYDEEHHRTNIENILSAIRKGNLSAFSEEILWIIASEEGKNIFSHPPGTFNDFKQQIIREIIRYKNENQEDFSIWWTGMEKYFIKMRDRSGLKKDDKYPKFYTDLLKFENDQPALLDFWRNEKLPNIEELLV